MLGIRDRLKQNQTESTLPRSAPPATANTPKGIAGFKDRKKFEGACILPIAKIVPDPDQPRKTFSDDSITRTAASLTSIGQLVPILVRYDEPADSFIIIDGERRFRAATLAGLVELSCVVDNEANRETVLEIQLVVNALREDVNPMEQARAWARLAEIRRVSIRELARSLNYDHSMVGRKISLLSLPEEIQAAIEANQIPQETGIALAQVADPVKQAELSERAIKGDLPRSELRQQTAKSSRTRSAKARTKGKSKPITSRTFKENSGGYRITIERAKGINPATMLEALQLAVAQVEAEMVAEFA